MSKKSPQLRFEGFTDDWEERKLENIAQINKGIQRGKQEISSVRNELNPYPVYNGGKKASGYTDECNRENSVMVSEGGASAGYVNYYSGKYWSGGHNFTISNDTKHDTFFLLYVLQKSQEKLYKLQVGTGLPNIQLKSIKDFPIYSTSNTEQQKIGSFFKQLDNTIALHQRKLDLLKEQKKGFLQKMFPKNGAKVPELRFAGFADDWEERKLNEVSDIYDGTHQTPKYQDNGVMFLSVENIKTLTSNKFISREAFEDEFKIRPQRGDVLMTRIGDIGTANVVETDEDLAYYVSLALFKSEELNPYFLQASIYAPFVQDQIWKRTLHIAFPKKINKNEIGQVPINVPTLAEQTKIGSFFKQLDNTITLHQRKLDLLKEQKKGFLQKMFV